MTRIIKNKRSFNSGLCLVLVFLLIGGASCKKIIAPDGIIVVSNECGLKIDFFLDGAFQFSIEYEQEQQVENLADGTYLLEARRSGTGELVDFENLDVWFNRIYTWHVLSSAKIIIKNRYGETLNIYGDDVLSGKVEDQDDYTLYNVPYGDRKIEVKKEDDTLVGTNTISVLLDIDYEWTIDK